MHIPDGFIAPQMYVPAYAASAGLWALALRRLKTRLREEAIPRLAVLTALAFVLMMVAIPWPGGTSVHASGVALLAVFFGPWIAFVATSLVLLMQALVFGAGGITALPINALSIGLAGGLVAWLVYRGLVRWNRSVALVAAGWFSVVVPAALVAVALGVQPRLAHAADGTPLFFPFGLEITLPAVVIPHLVVGVGEGVLTLIIFRLFARWQPGAACTGHSSRGDASSHDAGIGDRGAAS
jgi:cobalt/nickel transport system permease protein